jgi:hypothetical protein
MAESSSQWNAVSAECAECGLRAKVSPTDHDIVDSTSKCKHKQGWGHCSNLRAALSAANQSLRKL